MKNVNFGHKVEEFTKETTFHGVKYVFDGQTKFFRRYKCFHQNNFLSSNDSMLPSLEDLGDFVDVVSVQTDLGTRAKEERNILPSI